MLLRNAGDFQSYIERRRGGEALGTSTYGASSLQ